MATLTGTTPEKTLAADDTYYSNAFVSTAKEKIHLTQAEETCLASLFCRVQDTKSAHPILGDVYAQETLNRCEVDQSRTTFSAGQRLGNVIWASYRALTLDQWCEDFILTHKEPVTVLHLACGLDCRYLRIMDRLRGMDTETDIRWIDLDKPMVVDLRQRIFTRPRGDYTLRTLDLSKEGWLQDLPADRPTLVVAEGLFYYLEPNTVQSLLCDLPEYFPSGQIAFDKLGKLSISLTSRVQFLKSSKSAFKWGVDDPKDIEAFHSKLKLKDCMDQKQYMKGCIPMYGKMNALVSLHPRDKFNGQFLRFYF
ncbi:hypothetical protein N0V93_003064 [Gnomoniopsis smithogilvyi]|uniref:Leucine carboxyl methyltransferase n=1 Tax=Gnomoniopsis smithogilvyi TaxID=1191159 RepID=A0A9W8YXL9_9PEZI|nr:hypothetical protein N0V93_003064 [Gnomoniopsis smithogilvyi]